MLAHVAVGFRCAAESAAAFLELPESASLTAANKRIANILRKSAAGVAIGQVDVEALKEAAEVRLFDSMRALRRCGVGRHGTAGIRECARRLAQLRPAVDEFFDQVMVMDEDPRLRNNRLALLAQLQGLFAGVADLSRLPG